MDMRSKILDSTEALFAQRGFHGVSMRQIADGATASISLVQYHFKTKEALFGAVMERRIMAINHDRLRRLDAVELESARTGKVHLEDVLHAFLAPTVLLSRDRSSGGNYYAQLLAQVTNDPQPHARAISKAYTDPIARQTIRVLQLALPDLDRPTLIWCYIFAVGSMVSAISPTGRVRVLSNGDCDPDDVATILAILVPFLCGAFERIAELSRKGTLGKQLAAIMPLPAPAGAVEPAKKRRKAPASS